MSRETGLLLSELVKGNGYRSLYLLAVVSLVANTTTTSQWNETLVPETLSLDKNRLMHLHTEFNCIVDRSVALTFVAHVVIGGGCDKNHPPPADKCKVCVYYYYYYSSSS